MNNLFYLCLESTFSSNLSLAFEMFTFSLLLSKDLNSILVSLSPVKSLFIFPSSTKDIIPVSSETTITKASDTSLIPIAALCLVPTFFGTIFSEASGKTHLAAFIWLFSIIIAIIINVLVYRQWTSLVLRW